MDNIKMFTYHKYDTGWIELYFKVNYGVFYIEDPDVKDIEFYDSFYSPNQEFAYHLTYFRI